MSNSRSVATVWLILLAACLVVSGCKPALDTSYATTRGKSINGISCFINELRQSGRKVDIWPGISPEMTGEYDTLLIMLDSYNPKWIREKHKLSELVQGSRHLQVIMVVRDCDLQLDYWQLMSQRTDLKEQQLAAVKVEYQDSLAAFSQHANSAFEFDSEWKFGLAKEDRQETSNEISVSYVGDEGLKTVDSRWRLNRRLLTNKWAQVLWKSGDDPLLIKEDTSSGEHLVLSSAAPILNGGQVNKGNRVLAADLINRIPQSGRVAIALSMYWYDPSDRHSPGIFQFIKVHPNGWVFGQAILALLLFCWWKFPIFGRPRIALNTETARFGRHVEAFGRLLRRTQNTDFARQKIRDWHDNQSPRKPSDS